MNEWIEMWQEGIAEEGVTVTIVQRLPGERCTCFNESAGYGDPLWHISNPEAPECDDEAFLNSVESSTSIKCFMIPKQSISTNNTDQFIIDIIGKIEKYDYIYAGLNTFDVKALGPDDYIEYTGMRFRIKNADRYDIREEPLAYIAVLELIQNV